MSAREYLVTHGRAGSLGRFRATGDLNLPRGSLVTVRTRRGLEIGEALGPSRPENATLHDDFVGELLRSASADDRSRIEKSTALANQLCEVAARLAERFHLPSTVLDAEVMLDGRGAVLHGVIHAACDLGPLLEQLGESHGLIVRLYDLSNDQRMPEAAADHEESFKCDKPDCGEGHCSDCGDGGCNSCSAGGAKELAAYFAQLREQMEYHSRVPLV